MRDSNKTVVSAVICRSYEISELGTAVSEAVSLAGGWPEKVLKAEKILLKPNLLSARPPEQAVTTHPEFVRAVVREIRKLGCKKIYLGDSPAGNFPWEELWEKTGMKKVAEEENVELLPFNNIKRVNLPGTGLAPILKELGTFDAVISLPKLKTHILTKVTGAVKNTFGLIPGNAKSGFHGDFPSPRKMSDFLACLYGVLKPDFNIMDAVECMEGDGPSNGRPYKSNFIFAGADAVAIDSCVCAIYGYKYSDIPMLVKTEKLGFGVASPLFIIRKGSAWELIDKKEVKAGRSKSDFINLIPEFIFHPVTLFLKCRPEIDRSLCIKCGICAKTCSQNAIIFDEKSKKYSILKRKCILCMCCMESCPKHAVELASWFTNRRK